MTEAEVYRHAANVLRVRGWKQGGGDDGREPVCIMRALGIATSECSQAYRFDALIAVIGGKMVAWNDEPGRTFRQVLDALEQAAVLASA